MVLANAKYIVQYWHVLIILYWQKKCTDTSKIDCTDTCKIYWTVLLHTCHMYCTECIMHYHDYFVFIWILFGSVSARLYLLHINCIHIACINLDVLSMKRTFFIVKVQENCPPPQGSCKISDFLSSRVLSYIPLCDGKLSPPPSQINKGSVAQIYDV